VSLFFPKQLSRGAGKILLLVLAEKDEMIVESE
jgi:hypothetical protein